MNNICKSVLLSLLLLWLPLPALAGTELTIMTEERRPYAWIEHGAPRGICYELVAETMKELGLQQSIEFTSFTRGLALTKTQNNMALFSVTPSPERNRSFKWVGPLLQSPVYIYKLKKTPSKIDTLADLRQAGNIGVPRGTRQESFLKERGIANVLRFDSTTALVKALLNRRVDSIAVGAYALNASAHEIGVDPAQFEQTPLKLYDNALYIAFSKNVSDETIQRWQKALNKVKQAKFRPLSDKYLHQPPLPVF